MLVLTFKQLFNLTNAKHFIIFREFSKTTQEKVRVRFAPSPTGYLHLGGLRTALYNYLFALKHSGRFILRIEDTDQTRLVEGAIQQIQNDLEWSGIKIHEGPATGGDFGPYIQSQRLNLYKEHVKILLDNGSAYHCFCTDRRLELLRKEALRAREIPKYDNRCRSINPQEVEKKLAQGAQSCIRFKLSSAANTFHDLIYGKITYDVVSNEGDPVIIKSDGFPTYHFANVVDDHLMEISHVLRGVEWQISTPKHLLMYKAFNWEPPAFGHLPLLMNADGSKLSKRQGDIRISHYRDNGVFPLALINYIVTAGGGFGKDSERYLKPKSWTIEELGNQFDLSRINAHSGKLMPERLSEFNRLELKRKLQSLEGEKELVEQVREIVKRHWAEQYALDLTDEHIKKILNWSITRITTMSDLVSDDLKFVWISPNEYKITEKNAEYIPIFAENLNHLEVFNRDSLNNAFKKFSEEHQIKFGAFMKTLRMILSGLKEGPSVAEMMEILGKETTLSRLQLFVKKQQMR